MKLRELGVRDWVPMHLYEGGRSLSLTYFPGPSTSEMHIRMGCNSPNKQSDRSPKDPTAVNIARKENMVSGRGMLTQ